MRMRISIGCALLGLITIGSGTAEDVPQPAVDPAYAGHTPLLTGSEDWGAPPPGSDYAEAPLPELPPYAGWMRALSAGGDCTVLGASDGLVLVNPGAGVLAYDLATGELRWSYIAGEYQLLNDPCLFVDGRAYVRRYGPGIAALDMANGKLIWRVDGYNLLAAGASGIWIER